MRMFSFASCASDRALNEILKLNHDHPSVLNVDLSNVQIYESCLGRSVTDPFEYANLTEINDLVKTLNYSSGEGNLLRNEFKIELNVNENRIQKCSNSFVSRIHQIISNDDENSFTKKQTNMFVIN